MCRREAGRCCYMKNLRSELLLVLCLFTLEDTWGLLCFRRLLLARTDEYFHLNGSVFSLVDWEQNDRSNNNNTILLQLTQIGPYINTGKRVSLPCVAKWSGKILTWRAFSLDKDSYSVSVEWRNICSIDPWYWPFCFFLYFIQLFFGLL